MENFNAVKIHRFYSNFTKDNLLCVAHANAKQKSRNNTPIMDLSNKVQCEQVIAIVNCMRTKRNEYKKKSLIYMQVEF